MASHKTSTKGFTLLEVVIVVGMLGLLVGFGLFASMGAYRAQNFNASRNLLLTTLQHARMQALNNVCDGAACQGGLAHGVHIDTSANGQVSGFILFQGTVYDASDPFNIFIDSGSHSLWALGMSDVVFEPLSADAVATGTIVLWSGVSTSTISIGDEGQII